MKKIISTVVFVFAFSNSYCMTFDVKHLDTLDKQIRGKVESFLNKAQKKLLITYPKMNTYDYKDKYVFNFLLANTDKENITLLITDKNILNISGHTNKLTENQTNHIKTREIFYGDFNRSIPLADDIDSKNIKVVYKNNILKITILKDKNKIENKTKLLKID